MSFFHQLAEHGAQNIGAGSEFPAADAVAYFFRLEARHEAERLAELGDNGGAGGSDELVRFIDLSHGDAGEDFECRRRGERKGPVGALDPTAAVVQGGDVDFVDAQGLDADAGADDVGDGIESTDLMEPDLGRRDAVNLPFRHGDALENTESVLFDKQGEIAVLDELADLRVVAAMGMLVSVVVVTVLVAMLIVMVFVLVMAMPMIVPGTVLFLVGVLVRFRVAIPRLVSVAVDGMLWMNVLFGMRMSRFVSESFGVLSLISVIVILRMRMRVLVSVAMVVGVAVLMTFMMMVMVVVVIRAFVLIVRVGGALVDPEFHAFDVLSLRPLEVHVKVPEGNLGELPLEGGRLDAEIAQSAYGHVATDAGKTVEKENLHSRRRKGVAGAARDERKKAD